MEAQCKTVRLFSLACDFRILQYLYGGRVLYKQINTSTYMKIKEGKQISGKMADTFRTSSSKIKMKSLN